jgi:alkylhydroperoxidase family enzyme
MAEELQRRRRKARVLVDHGEYKIDQILEGAAAERAVADGLADDHPTAVAYAQKLARRKAREAADAED